MNWLPRRTSLTCRRAVDLLTDYLDEALPPADRRRLERHLSECPHCAEYLTQLRRTIAATGRVGPEDLSPALRDALAALYRQNRPREH
jgi:anti-sigma factor RsiW